MIAREWKCRVPHAQTEGFITYLHQTGLQDSKRTPGFCGAQLLKRPLAEQVELTLITYWDTLAAIQAFAGSDISQARLYPEDWQYELDPDAFVLHYEVIAHQFSL